MCTTHERVCGATLNVDRPGVLLARVELDGVSSAELGASFSSAALRLTELDRRGRSASPPFPLKE
jgi:hypothetical protein